MCLASLSFDSNTFMCSVISYKQYGDVQGETLLKGNGGIIGNKGLETALLRDTFHGGRGVPVIHIFGYAVKVIFVGYTQGLVVLQGGGVSQIRRTPCRGTFR